MRLDGPEFQRAWNAYQQAIRDERRQWVELALKLGEREVLIKRAHRQRDQQSAE